MLMLRNVRLIDPASKTDGIRDIIITDRKFLKIGIGLVLDASMLARAKGERLEIIDCRGLVAAPGLIDVHVHMRDPGFTHKESILTAAAAAAAGGFTTIIGMANTNPPIDDEAGILHVLTEGRKTGIRVKTCATITRGMAGKELVDMKHLKECGAAGFTDDGKPLVDIELVKEAMKTAVKLKMPLSFHEEDPECVKECGVNHGSVSEQLGLYGAEAMAEIKMIERDCRLAGEYGAIINIQHLSTKEGVDIVRKAKKLGIKVHAEATPHHFSLTQEAVLKYGTNAKMNPPLRTQEDRLAIIAGIDDGTIDIIATDHAPHTREEKRVDFVDAPSGITGLETSLSLGIMNLVDSGYISLTKLISRMSLAPAKLYNLEGGMVKEDAPADIVVFDPEQVWFYDKTFSKSSNSPWFKSKLKGKVVLTICNGFIVYDGRE